MSAHPFGYTGRRWDGELGLYYYRARWYDPELGTFLQTDPIGALDYINLYSYVGLEPGNATDPSGMDAIKIYDHNQAVRQGHVGVIFVDHDGNATFAEFTGSGTVVTMEFSVSVDENGDVTPQGVGQAIAIVSMYWRNTMKKDKSVGRRIGATVFHEADNKQGFLTFVDSVAAAVNQNGGGSVSGVMFDGQGGASVPGFGKVRYSFLSKNCSDFADSAARAAGTARSHGGQIPNGNWRQESSSPLGRPSSDWWRGPSADGSYSLKFDLNSGQWSTQ